VHPQIHPGVLREVMLARIAGDVAGALNLPLLRRKGAGHAAAGPALSRAFPYHAYWNGDSTHPAFVSGSATLDHTLCPELTVVTLWRGPIWL
jgi:hypothetical protein